MRKVDDARESTPGESAPWTVVSVSGEREEVPNSGQLIRLILEGNVSRKTLLCQPGADPRPVGEVPGLSELFDDQRLRLFLKTQMQTWSATEARVQVQRFPKASVVASVALMTALLAGAYFASQRSNLGRPTPEAPEAAPSMKQGSRTTS
jgi:hypothetical protein